MTRSRSRIEYQHCSILCFFFTQICMVNWHINTQWRWNKFESVGEPVGAKVGGTGPGCFWSCPSTFLALKVQLCRFGEGFCDGQYSLVSFLFSVLLTVPRAQPFVKVGRHVPRAAPVPASRRHCKYEFLINRHTETMITYFKHCKMPKKTIGLLPAEHVRSPPTISCRYA